MSRKMQGLVASVAAGALLCIVAVGHGATRSVELADVRVLSALFLENCCARLRITSRVLKQCASALFWLAPLGSFVERKQSNVLHFCAVGMLCFVLYQGEGSFLRAFKLQLEGGN